MTTGVQKPPGYSVSKQPVGGSWSYIQIDLWMGAIYYFEFGVFFRKKVFQRYARNPCSFGFLRAPARCSASVGPPARLAVSSGAEMPPASIGSARPPVAWRRLVRFFGLESPCMKDPNASSNKRHASSNKCLTSSNKKLLIDLFQRVQFSGSTYLRFVEGGTGVPGRLEGRRGRG